ncbi:suppressor of fused domain protein [Brevibacillus panacihumi]|nr:suppressor of fused domain protein [Brevibacillus panacihumi]
MHMIMAGQLLQHCNTLFGAKASLYQYEAADVLIAVYPPTKRRGWWSYVTLELHRTGESECVMYSYRFETQIVAHLAAVSAQIIRQWEEGRERIQTGSVYRLEQPVAEKSILQYVMAAPLDFEEEGFDYFTDGRVVVRLLMLHAIARDEAEFLERHGFAALEELFVRAGVDSLDLMRHPVVGGGMEQNEDDRLESNGSS